MKFRDASADLLSDFLTNLNKINKFKLRNVSNCSENFRDARLTEYIFLMTKELKLDPAAGFHAVEILQKFIVKHLSELLTEPTPQGATEGGMFDMLKENFPVLIFSCVQLSSKLSFLTQRIDNDTAVRFLHSVGHSVSKQALLESELMVLKVLEFRINDPNPLTYVEVLLEVLGNNQPSIPVERLHELCHHVLQFVSLERKAIFDSLLVSTTQCASPSKEQREKFVAVTEDYMLLGVGVIAVASFIHWLEKWKQIVEELSHITGISSRSISDFARVTLMHIVRDPSSCNHLP
ncbi:cyclin N-terminal domain-containing protein 1 [Takifugu rubripes]|uniref:cyclin N-terminal domain-containing protein 1 n=1 Tax=Takifugu rubripes TaxID=31033 RepID=UPI0005D2A91C|nr:cyclin N-terminal domain-containing protein 1 [Takifugu rubripes]XP_056914217.1 cyclin N-terminal domain-containing protein 1 [Takifugu flavidus]|eukprot:XP_011616387.1 PREDICTED: cyclin N-terminal domain-containing protein 1 isoform X1 [Takifugu rubripes]